MKSSRKLLIGGVVLAAAIGGYLFWSSMQSRRIERDADRLLEQARDQREFQDNPSEAYVLLKRASRLRPDSWDILHELGRVCLDLDRIHEAVEALNRAVDLCQGPEQPRIQLTLGHAYRQLHEGTAKSSDHRRAMFAFEAARARPDLEAEALYHLGVLTIASEKLRDPDRSKGYFEELLRRYPESDRREKAEQWLELIGTALARQR